MRSTVLAAAGILLIALVGQARAALDVLGYYFVEESFDSLQGEAKNWLTQVSFDQFAIDNKGNVKGSVSPPNALRNASSKFQTFLCVSNYGPNDFNGPRIHAVLMSKKATARLVNQLVTKAKQMGFTGVNIDFEAVPRRDRARLTSFMQTLSTRLRAIGLKLVMSVPAMSENNPNDDWSGAFDYAALGKAVDVLQIMTYDQHGPWGESGPVAGLDWVKACIDYAKTVLDPKKISMGVPAYAYDWNIATGKGVSVNQDEVEAKLPSLPAPKWDATSSSPYVEYTSNGQKHVMWFENAQSLQLKGDYARSSGIGGVSVWALYGDTTAFWRSLLG